jgi:transcriptional regulator with XRE-family HTH domain
VIPDQFFPTRNEAGDLAIDAPAVRSARVAARLTQQELSQRMLLLGYQLSQPCISKIEHGQLPWGFTGRMATALAAALGVEVTAITGGCLLTRVDVAHVRNLTGQIDQVVEPSELGLHLVAS